MRALLPDLVEDPFALLGIDRALYIDPERLDAVFNDNSKKYHPDIYSGEDGKFEQLNAAYQTLRVTSSRLKALRMLEFSEIEPARGAAMAAVAIKGIPVFEYAPLKIKQSLLRVANG